MAKRVKAVKQAKKSVSPIKAPKVTDFFADAKRMMSPESYALAEAEAEELKLTLALRLLRERLGKRQQDLPELSQEAVSRFENQTDARVSTTRRYVKALNYRFVTLAVPRDKKGDTYVLEGEDAVKIEKDTLRLPTRAFAVSALRMKPKAG